jgi:hypothetical protein
MHTPCEAGCGYAEWVVTLASCKVFFLCGDKALLVLKLAGEKDCPSHIATLEAAAMELASHYTAAGADEMRKPVPRYEDEKEREFEHLHWRNRAAE